MTQQATGIKQGSALISLAEAHDGPNMTIATNHAKPSIGKTGVHLRYHKHHKYKRLTHEQRHELSEWRQNNPDAHKPSQVKKSHVTGGPTKSKQISTLVAQQVAAEMKKYNPTAHVGSTNTTEKPAADEKQHLMSMVQSAVAQHFATQPNQPNPIRRPLPISQPPPNWREVFEQYSKRTNKST